MNELYQLYREVNLSEILAYRLTRTSIVLKCQQSVMRSAVILD